MGVDGYVDSNKAAFDGVKIRSASRSAARYGLDSCTSSSSTAKIHVVMVPYPVQGQINPMMQFAKLLISRLDDVVVTLVNNKHNHDHIQQTRRIGAAANHTSSNIHLAWVDSGYLPADFDLTAASQSDVEKLHESTVFMKEPLKELLQALNCRSALPVSCVLFGAMIPSAQTAAAELHIPNFLFWTQSAALFSIYFHLPLLISSNFFPYGKKCVSVDDAETTSHLVTCIPGLPPLHPSSFPSLLQVDDVSDPSLATVREQFSSVQSCSGILINSFQELENDAWQALQQELPYPVSLVGPLLPPAFTNGGNLIDKTFGASLVQEKSDCIKWLDGQQKHSVLYISFGSLFKPSSAELGSIALGIQASKQPFLWVIRPCKSSELFSEWLPKGFVEDTRDYGLIIPWAPQLQVLAHPAVGAFLTHCGWNSTLESLTMGMPMISFPLVVDQPTNEAYVCDVWKVGMALKRQEAGKLKIEDIAKVLRTVLHEEEGARMRERAKKLSDAARQAVQANLGSSHVHIQKFIQALVKSSPSVDELFSIA